VYGCENQQLAMNAFWRFYRHGLTEDLFPKHNQ